MAKLIICDKILYVETVTVGKSLVEILKFQRTFIMTLENSEMSSNEIKMADSTVKRNIFLKVRIVRY